MLTIVLYALVAIVIAAGLFVLATRLLPAGEQIAPALRDEAPWELPPEQALSPEDIDGIRLPVALRGYRFAETDILLDRLAGELRERDAEIARLRGTAAPATELPDSEPAEEIGEPVPDEPVSEEPVSEEPVTDEPVTDEPVTDEPVTDEPRHVAD